MTVDPSLTQDEHVVLLLHPHWKTLIRPFAVAVLVIAIMVIGSIVLWAGTPLAWLWIGAQIQGATQSLGAALAAAFATAVAFAAWMMLALAAITLT